MKQKPRSTFFNVTFIMSLLFLGPLTHIHTALAGQMPPNALMNMTDDQLDELNQMMEVLENMSEDELRQIDAEINKFVGTLSPEEQRKFHQDVNELQTFFAGNTEEAPEQPAETPQEPKKAETPVVAPPVKPQQPTGKIQKAVQVIDNIIGSTERFLRTTHRIHELSGKVDSWVETNKIPLWNPNTSWATLKESIEVLVQKITLLKEKDPETKQYLHIDALLKDEATYNNLTKFSNDLTTYEPKVAAPSFGLGTISKESRAAIKQILSSYTEALYILNLQNSIDKIIAQSAPRTQQLKKQEEDAIKRAQEEAKKGRKAAPTRVSPSTAGSGYNYYDGGRGYDDFYDFDDYSGYSGGNYDYNYPSYGGSSTSYGPGDDTGTKRFADSDSGSAGYRGGPGARGTDAKDADKDGKKSDDKESDKKPVPEFKKSKEIEKIEDLIDEASDEIDEIREDHKIKSIPEFEQYLNKVMQDTGKKAALKKDEKKEKALKEDKKRVYDATQKIKLAKKRKNKKLSSDKEKKEAKKSIDDRLEKDKYLLKIKERMRGEKVDMPEDAKEMTLVHELKKLSDAIIDLQK